MTENVEPTAGAGGDRAPGDPQQADNEAIGGLRSYLIGLGFAIALTVASFGLPATGLVWAPAVPVALTALAIAQMGIHLVFFLHITTAPDNTNNALALAFGVLIVLLLIGGSLWIMTNLDHNMIPMSDIMSMQR